MHVHIVRGPADRQSRSLLEHNFRLRHKVFVERQGWEALRRPDGRDVDEFDNADATHILIIDGEDVVGGSRITPLDRPNLLQTVFHGLVQEDLPAIPRLGPIGRAFTCVPIDARAGGVRPNPRPFSAP